MLYLLEYIQQEPRKAVHMVSKKMQKSSLEVRGLRKLNIPATRESYLDVIVTRVNCKYLLVNLYQLS